MITTYCEKIIIGSLFSWQRCIFWIGWIPYEMENICFPQQCFPFMSFALFMRIFFLSIFRNLATAAWNSMCVHRALAKNNNWINLPRRNRLKSDTKLFVFLSSGFFSNLNFSVDYQLFVIWCFDNYKIFMFIIIARKARGLIFLSRYWDIFVTI